MCRDQNKLLQILWVQTSAFMEEVLTLTSIKNGSRPADYDVGLNRADAHGARVLEARKAFEDHLREHCCHKKLNLKTPAMHEV
jgi:hypothetical protein